MLEFWGSHIMAWVRPRGICATELLLEVTSTSDGVVSCGVAIIVHIVKIFILFVIFVVHLVTCGKDNILITAVPEI
jgi:hypothetical protein